MDRSGYQSANVGSVIYIDDSYIYILYVAIAQERKVEGDLFVWDMGEGLGFRPGTFDGAIRQVTFS